MKSTARNIALLGFVIGALSLVVTFPTATALAAAGAHFQKTPTATLDTSDGIYNVKFTEAGLGNSPVTYSLSAVTESFTFQCYTTSGHTPQGSPNTTTISNEAAQSTLTPRNGKITGTISLTPEVGSASCQGGGLTLCLTAVDYEGVALTDETNSVGPIDLPSWSASGLNVCGF